MALVCLYKHKQTLLDEWAGLRKTERKSFHQNIFLLEAAATNLSSPLGKHFQASQVSKIFAEGKTVWSDTSKRWLCRGTTRGWSLSLPHGHARARGQFARGWQCPAHLGFYQLLFDAFRRVLTVLQLLQLALGSLLCLADVLQQLGGLCAGFHSLQERGNTKWMATFIPLSKWGKPGTLGECPF